MEVQVQAEHPGYVDVPSGEVLLFESDIAVSGYTLLTTQNDMVVYITKGSAAGGEAGGTAKGGSTWSQPNHNHGITSEAAHVHATTGHVLTIAEMPAHTHTYQIYTYDGHINGLGGGGAGSKNTGSTGGNASHSHGNTGSAGVHNHGGTTADDATLSSWRPKGRNYTRQQRI